MKKKILVLVCVLTLILSVNSVNAEGSVVRIEAEAYAEGSNPAVADEAGFSGGRFIGFNSVSNHIVIYENVPASQSFVMKYRTLGTDSVLHIFIEKNGEFVPLLDYNAPQTGTDYSFPFLESASIPVEIPAGAKLKFTVTGDISIDYFDFTPAATNPSTGDTLIIPYMMVCLAAIILIKKHAIV